MKILTPPPSPALLRDTLLRMASFLGTHAVDSPRLSAEILLAAGLGMTREEMLKTLLLEPLSEVDEQGLTIALAYVNRRAQGEPAAYILGTKEFYGRDFQVTPDTLIPRPETELLVDLAIARAAAVSHASRPLFADFGTGSGCVAATLALELPHWKGIALDISSAALSVAAANARTFAIHALTFLRADFSMPPLRDASLDLLVSNPPYVSEQEYDGLDHEVRNFEPKSALVPRNISPEPTVPACGLEDALHIVRYAQTLLKPGGALFMEIGCTQGGAILGTMAQGSWAKAEIITDYAGRNRVVAAVKAD